MFCEHSKIALSLQIIYRNRFVMHFEPKNCHLNVKVYFTDMWYRKTVWLLTPNESTAQNTILEHRPRASLVACLWPGCPWMTLFGKIHIREPHAQPVSCDSHGHNWQEDPNFAFCCKVWSKIVSYLNKHEILPKDGVLSHGWLHTKSRKRSKGGPTVLSSSWRCPVNDFWAKSLNESWCQA